MNGDLLILLVASIVAFVLGLMQLFRSDWQDMDAAAVTILGAGVAIWTHPMTRYDAKPITQRDGHPIETSNCRMGAAASGIDHHTLGGTTSTAGVLRDRSGDPSGGTTSDDAVKAWHSYDEVLTVRDGRTFADLEDDLRAGRFVSIDVWHAKVGGPCLSGSGAYGHTMGIAPRLNSDGERWWVTDPWCKPAEYHWVDRDKLRAGAEEWADRCGYRSMQSGGARDIRKIPRVLLLAIVRELLSRWTPADPLDPALDDYPGAPTGGGLPILYTCGDPHGEATDVAIQSPESLTSDYYIEAPKGMAFFADSGLTDKLGEMSKAAQPRYVGRVIDGKSRAIIVGTGTPYDDKEVRPTIVYVKDDVEPIKEDQG